MCRFNTDRSVEKIPVPVLLHQSSRHIPWCLKARRAFVRHCVRCKLNFRTLKWKRLEHLLRDIHCDSSDVMFQCATRSRIESALRATLKKLVTMRLVRQLDDGVMCYSEALVDAALDDGWDGDLQDIQGFATSGRSYY
ncbi:hypothetical protein F4777DRAFT_185395 [Nemania sp. FL0916]|nr:hypothetical protein F4777DRAFT_185395 [Nemania sp. FL0916]